MKHCICSENKINNIYDDNKKTTINLISGINKEIKSIINSVYKRFEIQKFF